MPMHTCMCNKTYGICNACVFVDIARYTGLCMLNLAVM